MHRIQGETTAPGHRFAVVVARFNAFVTDRLEQGALEALTAAGIADNLITVLQVPGAFEIPVAARQLAASGRYAAVIGLGCLIRGATPHFEYISSAVSNGLTDVALATGVPVTFGVLTVNSAEEALERAAAGPTNKGYEAAMAAVEMVSAFNQLKAPPPGGMRA